MIYGYLRVSSDEQDVNSQKQGVESFCKEHDWIIDKFITDEGVSGGKDPDKRNLGPLLKLIRKGDKIICSEISRLGRDLYMVMDILHFCMERECIIYTVKDKFVLGDDISSKVLAFAFGLSAEIERQMIRQRTKEGLRLRMKMGVLLGRPIGVLSQQKNTLTVMEDKKNEILTALEYGASQRNIAKKVGIDRNTLYRYLVDWGVKLNEKEKAEYEKMEDKKRNERRKASYKDADFCVVQLPINEVKNLINADLTIPEIADRFKQYTYEQIYDTILCDSEFNSLYRKHGQLRVKKWKH